MTPSQRTSYRKFIASANSQAKCRKSRGLENCYSCVDFSKCELPAKTDNYLKKSKNGTTKTNN